MKSRIALDAMGGDFLAIPNLQGAFRAIEHSIKTGEELKIFLCGPRKILEDTIDVAATDPLSNPEYRLDASQFRRFVNEGRLEFVDCSEVVGMDESPSIAVRQKKDSSMAKCFQMVKAGSADAAVSAGNSGAMMAYGVSILGRLPLIKRPAILCHFPTGTQEGGTALLDAGANVDCIPLHLEQFAVLGKVYMQTVFDRQNPRIALLNIGEEEGKGNELVRNAHELLKARIPDNYVGFVEGRDIMAGKVDVIVCDGFVGNVALKTAEGVAKAVKSILKDEFSKNPIWGLGAWLARGGFGALKKKIDYREYGAAPLVGLNGLALVGHGSSDAKAIASAIRIGSLYVKQGLMAKLAANFSAEDREISAAVASQAATQ